MDHVATLNFKTGDDIANFVLNAILFYIFYI